MAPPTVGTDTTGSLRIAAALCGRDGQLIGPGSVDHLIERLLTHKNGPTLTPLSPQDERLLAAAIDLAQQSRDHGNHPFGALLASPSGEVLCQAENTVVTQNDITNHAELNLVSKACRTLTVEQLATGTLYTSTEPCAMCCGAIYWSRIPRVVYALGEDELAVLVGGSSELVLQLPSRQVFAAGSPKVEVSGPHLHGAGAAVHKDFWT
ncbi:deaminase [Streptomyces sp. NPDC005820]|uniref:nucleoside deaminase n=1 Tax=Streptomyces sp. NPDC005820 TaxID=3157069 RepID=UPI0033C558A5